MDFAVDEGELVTLLGRNGAGKTTTLNAIMGIIGQRSGSIRFAGTELIALPPNRIARLGIGYCPEERGIFASLDVEENLLLPPVVRPGGLSSTKSTRSSPTSPSGGAARAPSCRAASSRCWRSGASCAPAPTCCCSTSRPRGWPRSSCSRSARSCARSSGKGFTILLVEQNFRFAATVADRHYIVEHGRVDRHDRTTPIWRRCRQAARLSRGLRNKSSARETMRWRLLSRYSLPALVVDGGGPSADQPDTIKIGVLADMSSLYADLGGPGSVVGGADGGRRFRRHRARQENRGGQRRPPEQARCRLPRSPANGSTSGVEMITDLTTSSVALAVQEVAREKNKVI